LTVTDDGIETPFLRWAGGKTWLLKKLHKYTPRFFKDYHEPFIGAGAVFFYLRPRFTSYLSDSNFDLINAYQQMKNNIDDIIDILKEYQNTENYYYKIRDTQFHSAADKAAQFHSSADKAAQFIYLNRTCFNGLYRVNLDGKFNVPYGFKSYRQLFDYEKLRRFSELLKPATLDCFDFEQSLQNIRKGDLVFLDPPYTVSHTKNGFVKYNEKLFSWDDQRRLASYVNKIRKLGAFYILTNAKHPAIEALFGEIDTPVTVSRASVIGGRNAKRGMVQEYIFTNVQ
jgi:DNA adenine methylase